MIKGNEIRVSKRYLLIAVLFTITKMWNKPRYPSMDEWMKKMCVGRGGECMCVSIHNIIQP